MILVLVEAVRNTNIVMVNKNMDMYEIKTVTSEVNAKFQDIRGKSNIPELELELNNMKKQTEKEDFWDNPQKASLFLKQYKEKEEFLKSLETLDADFEELNFLIKEMPDEVQEIIKNLESIQKRLSELEIEVLLNGKYDSLPALLEIHPGAGGVESHDFAEMLLNMYERYFTKNNIKYKIIEYNKGEVAGIKSVTLEVDGKNSYGLLKGESGVHRLVRISPFDSGNRRHTSFASVKVTPVIEGPEFQILDSDLKIDTFRSSGAGGQSVNTTDSAVRITHLPTKLVVTYQNERSQIQNKEAALNILKSKLLVLEDEKLRRETSDAIGELQDNSFGSQKRSYILQPYRLVKDHVSNYETSQVDKVLQGDIEKLLYKNLIM